MDAIIAVIVMTLFILAFRKIGLWGRFWLGLAIYVGVFELIAKVSTGKTISQQYWAWAANSPWWWAPALLIAIGGIGLAIHLVWKKIHSKR